MQFKSTDAKSKLCSYWEYTEHCVIHLSMCNLIWHWFQWCHAWNVQPCGEILTGLELLCEAVISRCGSSLLELNSYQVTYLSKESFCSLNHVFWNMHMFKNQVGHEFYSQFYSQNIENMRKRSVVLFHSVQFRQLDLHVRSIMSLLLTPTPAKKNNSSFIIRLLHGIAITQVAISDGDD